MQALERMGCQADTTTDSIRLKGGALRGIDVDMEAMPDVVPTLAIVAAFAEDEWVAPSVVTTPDGTPLATAHDQDALLLFNFRSDRIQQLADFLVAHFARTGRQVTALSLTQYEPERRLAAARCKSCLLLIVGGNPCGEPKGDPDGVTN